MACKPVRPRQQRDDGGFVHHLCGILWWAFVRHKEADFAAAALPFADEEESAMADFTNGFWDWYIVV
jgi:hypothetical protein